jgi:hypothetical protein
LRFFFGGRRNCAEFSDRTIRNFVMPLPSAASQLFRIREYDAESSEADLSHAAAEFYRPRVIS